MATPSPIQTNHQTTSSPPISGSSTPVSAKRPRSPLSLDLSSLPPLSSPAPPSNTLLITRLSDPKIFHPASLATIREHITSISPLNSFSPLKSLHRIICSFFSTEDCIKVRQALDGLVLLPSQQNEDQTPTKCYFGESTPIDQSTKYLDRPDAGRLFFISPPPSPPVGWEMRHEDPPNKEVHAEDLASKLQRLTGRMDSSAEESSAAAEASQQQQYTSSELKKARSAAMAGLNQDRDSDSSPTSASPKKLRSRSSTLIYDPKAHGDSPALPAVMLETEEDSDVELDKGEKKPFEHTARPPVELMEE